MKALIGTKVGMTQIISDDGVMLPVTIIQAGPVKVLDRKTEEKHGYDATVLGYGEQDKNKVNKPAQGQFKKEKLAPKVIKEIRTLDTNNQEEALEIGASFDVSVFEKGDTVSVSGTSKGKGFAGTVKRYNFETSAKSHGGKGVVRRVGSIGSMYPQKVYKGRKMPGRMGADKVTVKNLKVALVDKDNHLLGIIGAVPGPKKGLVTVKGLA